MSSPESAGDRKRTETDRTPFFFSHPQWCFLASNRILAVGLLSLPANSHGNWPTNGVSDCSGRFVCPMSAPRFVLGSICKTRNRSNDSLRDQGRSMNKNILVWLPAEPALWRWCEWVDPDMGGPYVLAKVAPLFFFILFLFSFPSGFTLLFLFFLSTLARL